jgi:lysophospholipase L1-like esterase
MLALTCSIGLLPGCGVARQSEAAGPTARPTVAADSKARDAGNDPDGARRNGAGALSNVTGLHRFFDALARLDDRTASDDVRIVQFGDSHTAADFETAATRKALQARFGDGGRGFVAIGSPFRVYLQVGARGGMTRDVHAEHGPLQPDGPNGDGRYGLSGLAVEARRAARAWADLADPATSLEIAYLEQPGGGAFDLFVDEELTARIETNRATVRSAFKKVDVASAPHHVEVRMDGSGPVRLFGLAADNKERGVVLDALGINGARFSTGLGWDPVHMGEQLVHRSPALVILAYGTNESSDSSAPVVVARDLTKWLERLKIAVPTASCLVLGPPDRAWWTESAWRTLPRIVETVAAERQVAEKYGCGFFDQLEAMGGPGSIASWAEETPPRAQRDRVHLTRAGYVEMGSMVASDIVRAFEVWRAESQTPVAHR